MPPFRIRSAEHGRAAARGIRFAELHADRAHADRASILLQDFERCGQEFNLDAFFERAFDLGLDSGHFEERQLLRAVRRIVGRVQIDGDAIGAMAQPLGVTPDHALSQELARTI